MDCWRDSGELGLILTFDIQHVDDGSEGCGLVDPWFSRGLYRALQFLSHLRACLCYHVWLTIEKWLKRLDAASMKLWFFTKATSAMKSILAKWLDRAWCSLLVCQDIKLATWHRWWEASKLTLGSTIAWGYQGRLLCRHLGMRPWAMEHLYQFRWRWVGHIGCKFVHRRFEPRRGEQFVLRGGGSFLLVEMPGVWRRLPWPLENVRFCAMWFRGISTSTTHVDVAMSTLNYWPKVNPQQSWTRLHQFHSMKTDFDQLAPAPCRIGEVLGDRDLLLHWNRQ